MDKSKRKRLSLLDYMTEFDYCSDNNIRKESCVELYNDPFSECPGFNFDLTDMASVTVYHVFPDFAS